MHGSGRDIRLNASKNPEGTRVVSTSPFNAGGLWIAADGLSGLADPVSPAQLAASHPFWSTAVSRHEPWETVVLGEEAGPAAGSWQVSRKPTDPAGPAVLVVGTCPSSLDVGWTLLDAGMLPPFASVLALSQRQGRGQMRRDWQSPAGNLYAALVWPTHTGNLDSMAPVLVGYCLAEAFAAQDVPVLVKWPNDLLLDGKKMGGILLEERHGRTLAGIGINCASAPKPAALRRDHAAEATALADHWSLPGLLDLWTGLVQYAQNCYRQSVMLSGSGERSQLISRRLAWLGREVLVREAETDAFRARIMGLAEDGGLRLRRSDAGSELDLTLHCGSISLL